MAFRKNAAIRKEFTYVYQGDRYKCEYCGELIKSFETVLYWPAKGKFWHVNHQNFMSYEKHLERLRLKRELKI